MVEATILIGTGREISGISRQHWESHLRNAPDHVAKRLAFMTDDHRRVRNFVVKELPRFGKPISPEVIASELSMPSKRITEILDELERKLFFLVRDRTGAVSWAYPLTAETTPHRLTFSTGERLYAAWGEDAMAAPFVQGQLQGKELSVTIHTVCSHCDREIEVDLDSEMRFIVRQPDANPLVFQPTIDWESFSEPNIIHAFWQNSVFFWSEEHAREDREAVNRVDGMYLTLEQSAFATPIVQGALFGF